MPYIGQLHSGVGGLGSPGSSGVTLICTKATCMSSLKWLKTIVWHKSVVKSVGKGEIFSSFYVIFQLIFHGFHYTHSERDIGGGKGELPSLMC